MNKNNKIKTNSGHRLAILKAEFSKLKTKEAKKDYRAELNNKDRLLLRKLNPNNKNSLTIVKSNLKKTNFELDKSGLEITPLSKYKKLSNLITKNIEELPTYRASIQLNPISKKCPFNCQYQRTCGEFSPDIDFPIIASGVKRNQITDELKFYSKLGLFGKFAINTPQLWKVETIDEIKKVYYIVRSKGYSVSFARQLAKLEAFKIGSIYSQTWKAIQNNYKAKKSCTCSECFFGREFNCLNGELKPYKPIYASIEETTTIQELNNILLANYIESKKNKVKAGKFIERIYNLCGDETDARIVNLTLSGKSKAEIISSLNLSRKTIYNKLVKIGVNYNRKYNTK